MSSLLELQKSLGGQTQYPSASPAPTPAAKPAPEPHVAGDELMAKAEKLNSFSDDETRYAKLFQTSDQLVEQRMQADPAWAEAFTKKIQPLKGEALASAIIDAGDEVRIKHWQEKDPQMFSEAQAGNFGFFNTVTFGQLTKIMGKAGELIQGRPYAEVVEEQGEKFRLMAKAYPKSNLAGQAAAFMVPGSPAKFLFDKAAKLGAAGGNTAKILLERVSRNPQLLTRLVEKSGQIGSQTTLAGHAANAVQSGMAAATGTAAYQGVAGSLGENHEGFDLDRGLESAANGAMAAFVVGTGVAGAGAGLGVASRAGAPLVKRAASATNRGFANVIEDLTGTDSAALRAYNRLGSGLKKHLNAESGIGDDLVDHLLSAKRSRLPEVQKADELLDGLPDVDATRLLEHLKNLRGSSRPDLKKLNGQLDEWVKYIEARVPRSEGAAAEVEATIARRRAVLNGYSEGRAKQLELRISKIEADAAAREASWSQTNLRGPRPIDRKPIEAARQAGQKELEALRSADMAELASFEKQLRGGVPFEQKIPARTMREIVDTLQDAADAAYGEESNLLMAGLKTAARRARLSIVEAAEASGTEHGATYVKLMEKAAEKRQVLTFLQKRLGSNIDTMQMRSKGFVDRLFGSNSELSLKRMADLDTKFGTNFVERARLAQQAQSLGADAAPKWTSGYGTGAAVKGIAFGSAIGGGVGLVTGDSKTGATVGGAIGAVASSPRAGAFFIGQSDKITGFVRRMTSQPEVLSALARRVAMGAVKNPAESRAQILAFDKSMKQITSLRVPGEIQQLAQAIQQSMVKDGPQSAAGVVRLVADTPYFVGLAHYFDAIEQRLKSGRGYDAMARQQQQGEGIATPKQ